MIHSNALAYCVMYCSAQVESVAFTGYNASGKKGVVTEIAGPRHIKTIDGEP